MTYSLICCVLVAAFCVSKCHETDQQFSGPEGPTKAQTNVIKDEVERLGHTGKTFDELTAQDRENIKAGVKIGLDDLLLNSQDTSDSGKNRSPPSMMRPPSGNGKAPGSPSGEIKAPGRFTSANPSMQDDASANAKATGPKAPGMRVDGKEPTRPGLKNMKPPSPRRPGPAGPPTMKQRNEL